MSLSQLIAPLLGVLVFMCVVMALGWQRQKATGNGGWVDVFWTYGTGIAGVTVALTAQAWPPSPRQWVVAALLAMWSFRLGTYILIRVAKADKDKAHEDVRYTKLKKEWGDKFQGRMFWFMQIQSPATVLLCLAVLLAAGKPGDGLGLTDLIGAAILILAIVGEAMADQQMAAFRAAPGNKGKVCDTGLWGLSRHPNYLFEWLGWFAYPVIAFDMSGADPFWALGLLGPVFMYLLLRYMTGVPPLEEAMLRSRPEAFADYQRKVPVFLPFLPARPVGKPATSPKASAS